MTCERPPDVILIEDNPDHAELFRLTVEGSSVVNLLDVFSDGETALRSLEAGTISRPSAILLDLNLPKMNGFEVLQALRAGDARDIPVIVLTTSSAECDRSEARERGIASYLVKPVDVEQLREALCACVE